MALLLVTFAGCGEDDEDGCSEANDVAVQLIDQAERDGIAPETACNDPGRSERYDALCERHAELMAECDD